MSEDRRMRDQFGCFNEMSNRMTGGEDSPSFLLLFAIKKKSKSINALGTFLIK